MVVSRVVGIGPYTDRPGRTQINSQVALVPILQGFSIDSNQ
jgi:hypothetical protein